MSSMPPFPNQRSMSLTRPVTSPTVVPGWDSVEAELVAERRGLPRHPCRPGAPRDGRRHAGRDAGGATSLLDRAVKFFRAAPPHHRITARSSHQAEHGRQAPVPPDLGRRSTMTNAVIVDAVRTAGGKRNGKLRNWHSADLASEPLMALVERNDLDPALVDDVIMGCVMQVGEQSLNVGRNAVLAAGFPESVPATTIDRQCGSSQQAAHFGAQGVGAERIADQWGLSREDLDEFSVRSHRLAAQATAEGRFEREIIPVAVKGDDGADTDELVTADEGIRPDSSVEVLGNLKPAFRQENGKVTAGNSSQITDGASGVLIMSEEKAAALGLTPRARFHSFAVVGSDPITMLTGPIPATRAALEKGKLTLDDIDIVEINEAFASVPLAWAKELGADLDKVNVNGGAIALGHPLGASGAKLMATLLNELERTNGRYGLLTMCEGGGMANATIIERLG